MITYLNNRLRAHDFKTKVIYNYEITNLNFFEKLIKNKRIFSSLIYILHNYR